MRTIELNKDIIGLASAITVASQVNKPKAKRLKEILANRILTLIEHEQKGTV